MSTPREVVRRIQAHRQSEGGGFIVRRPFPTHGLEMVDPFLMVDEMGPVTYGPGEAVGAPDHPHRGFETISYILEGAVEHHDSVGHHGIIEPGGVQWMTAGDGVVHREMPTEAIRRDGGRAHGFQVWVNLPKSHKRMRPRYQERSAEQIPEVQTDDGLATVRLVAGEALGTTASISTHVPIAFHHWTLRAGAQVDVPLDPQMQACVYVFGGSAQIAGESVGDGQLVVLGSGDHVALQADADAQLLLLAGVPLREPVARYGPFVMNTRQELMEAFDDFQAGRMGKIEAELR